jgi:hypothetical protein
VEIVSQAPESFVLVVVLVLGLAPVFEDEDENGTEA